MGPYQVSERLRRIAKATESTRNAGNTIIALQKILAYLTEGPKFIFMKGYTKEDAEAFADDWSAGPVQEVEGGVMMEVPPDFIESYWHSSKDGTIYVEPLEGFEIYPVVDQMLEAA